MAHSFLRGFKHCLYGQLLELLKSQNFDPCYFSNWNQSFDLAVSIFLGAYPMLTIKLNNKNFHQITNFFFDDGFFIIEIRRPFYALTIRIPNKPGGYYAIVNEESSLRGYGTRFHVSTQEVIEELQQLEDSSFPMVKKLWGKPLSFQDFSEDLEMLKKRTAEPSSNVRTSYQLEPMPLFDRPSSAFADTPLPINEKKTN